MKPLTITDLRQAPSFGLREHLATLFRHKRKIALIFFTAVSVAVVGSFLTSKVYVASSRILIQPSRQVLQLSPLMAPGTVAQIAPREQVSTEVEIFASPVLAQRAVERLGAENVQQHMRWRWDWARELPEQMKAWIKAQLFGWTITGFLLESLGMEQDLGGEADPSGDAAARIQESLTVSQILQTDVFLVEVRAPSPAFAALVVNTLVEAYIARHLELRQPRKTKEVLAEEATRLREQLRIAVERLQEYKRRWRVYDVDAKKTHLLERVNKAEIIFEDAQRQALEIEARIAGITAQLAKQSESIGLNRVKTRNPLADILRTTLTQLELEEAQYVRDSPAAVQVRKGIADVRARLSQLESNVEGSQTFGINQAYQELEKALLLARSERGAYESNVRSSEKLLREYRERLESLDEREFGFRDLQRDVQVKEVALLRFLEKEEEVRVNDTLNLNKVSNVKPIEMASAPVVPRFPRKKLNIGIAAVLGLVVGLWFAYACEFFRRTISTKEEAEEVLGKPVLGSIWTSKKKSKRLGDNLIEFRRLAQAVAEAREKSRPASFLVTSTSAGEGKSFVTWELAKAIGQANSRVLVVEIDTDHGSSSTSSNETPTDGDMVSDIRQWEPSQPEPSSMPHVEVMQLPANAPTNPSFQVLGERLLRTTEQFKKDYDIILIDGASIDAQPELLRAVPGMGGIFVVVEAEKTPGFAAARSLQMIESAGGSILGVILNKRRDVIPDWVYTSLLSPKKATTVA